MKKGKHERIVVPFSLSQISHSDDTPFPAENSGYRTTIFDKLKKKKLSSTSF
jgi:hypothetical protein